MERAPPRSPGAGRPGGETRRGGVLLVTRRRSAVLSYTGTAA